MELQGENILLTNKHWFFCIEEQLKNFGFECQNQIDYIKNNFCGNVLENLNNFDLDKTNVLDTNIIFYLTGDISINLEFLSKIPNKKIFVIKDLSFNYTESNEQNYQFGSQGIIPINIFGLGIYFRNFFSSSKDYFNLIENSHAFQELTDSNKPTNAYRSGIYLSKVKELDDNKIKFNLLRCSTNFAGPTDNFRPIDNEIVVRVNLIAQEYFSEPIELNHVLAQIYSNTKSGGELKNQEKKAKIKDHSDKTKDMPKSGLMGFCSFYKGYQDNKFCYNQSKLIKRSELDQYDFNYKDTSILTKLRFRLKSSILDLEKKLPKHFDLTLYPNSVFLMSLSTNRLYTHEIIPSVLPVDMIPTRLGYVIRCSNVEAIHKDGQTWIIEPDNLVKLEKATVEKINELRKAYYIENTSAEIMNYPQVYFSMNDGDYLQPLV